MFGGIIALVLIFCSIIAIAENESISLFDSKDAIKLTEIKDKGMIKIVPLHPYNAVLASIPKPVFNMNDLEPKPETQDFEEEQNAPLRAIMNQIMEYYSEELNLNNTIDPKNTEIKLYRDGLRYGMLLPPEHETVKLDPKTTKIAYGNYDIKSRSDNETVPPVVVNTGRKRYTHLWVFMMNETTVSVDDNNFRFFFYGEANVIDKKLYLGNKSLNVLPAQISPINYNNIEYTLYLNTLGDKIKYYLEYNNTNGVLVLDANDDSDYYINKDGITIDGVKIESNDRIDLGGQGFITALLENESYIVTKDTLNMPVKIDSDFKISEGRIIIGDDKVSVAPEKIIQKYPNQDIKLIKMNNRAWYFFENNSDVKILYLIPAKMKLKNYISATSMEDVIKEKPWWDFLVIGK